MPDKIKLADILRIGNVMRMKQILKVFDIGFPDFKKKFVYNKMFFILNDEDDVNKTKIGFIKIF